MDDKLETLAGRYLNIYTRISDVLEKSLVHFPIACKRNNFPGKMKLPQQLVTGARFNGVSHPDFVENESTTTNLGVSLRIDVRRAKKSPPFLTSVPLQRGKLSLFSSSRRKRDECVTTVSSVGILSLSLRRVRGVSARSRRYILRCVSR